MTKQEAIQEQIDSIMDTFRFDKVHAWMTAAGWYWGEPGSMRVPDVSELRREARQRLKEAANNGFASSGGFTATSHEDEDENGPWIKLDLYFGYQSLNDGTSYTK